MKSILIIQTAFVGDAILASAIVESLHAAYPTAEIDFLLRKGNEILYKNHPFIKTVLVWNKRESKYRNLLSLIKIIRTAKYDVVINLQRFAASGILTAFSGAERKIGFDKNPFSFLYSNKYTHDIPKYKKDSFLHEIDRNHSLIADLPGVKPALPRLYPSQETAEKIAEYKQYGPYICVAPASVWFTKQWPFQKWIELISTFKNHRVYLLGSKDDLDLCEKIRSGAEHHNIHILASELNLLESAELMKYASMNYVNDSAPMHLCSAVNAPVTAIYCSTIPEFGFGPLSSQAHVVEVKEKLSCRPCGLHGHRACPEGHFKCALDIKIEDIPVLK